MAFQNYWIIINCIISKNFALLPENNTEYEKTTCKILAFENLYINEKRQNIIYTEDSLCFTENISSQEFGTVKK